MRNSTLINILVLSSSLALPACVSEDLDDGEATGSIEGAVTADGELAPSAVDGKDDEGPQEEPSWIDAEPHEITADQIDSKGLVREETLECGLSILDLGDRTGYWIRNCFTYEAELIVVALDNPDAVNIEGVHLIQSLRTISGSARGRVLRLRRN
jgi:hypothetical protein